MTTIAIYSKRDHDDPLLQRVVEAILRLPTEVRIHYYHSLKDIDEENRKGMFHRLYIFDVDRYGITAASHIRNRHSEPAFLFLSDTKAFSLKLLELQPLYYLSSCTDRNEIERITFLAYGKTNIEQKAFAYREHKNIWSVPYRDILYFEVDGRILSIVTTGGKTHSCYARLKQVEEICPSNFLRTHASYLVNMEHIEGMTYEHVFLKTGTKVKIGRKYTGEARVKYEDYLYRQKFLHAVFLEKHQTADLHAT